MSEELVAIKKYHEKTKHSRRRIWAEDYSLDWASEPDPHKAYEGGPRLNIPVDADLPTGDVFSAIKAAYEARASKDAGPSLAELSQIIHLSYGVTKRRVYQGYAYDFRAAPSAGALYPIELYLCAGAVNGLADGLYHYSAKESQIILLKKGDLLGQLCKASSHGVEPGKLRILFILTSIFWRSAWKYRGRAYRYCLLDAGHLAANLLLASSALGYRALFIPDFIDAAFNEILGADGRREAALCAVGIEVKSDDIKDAAKGIPPFELGAKPKLENIYRGEKGYEPIENLHKTTSLTMLRTIEGAESEGQAAPALRSAGEAKPIPLSDEPLKPGAASDLKGALIKRRSVRRYVWKTIPFRETSAMIGSSAQGYRWAGFNGAFQGGLIDEVLPLYIQAGCIESVAEGIYLYSCARRELHKVAPGDLKKKAWKACMEQDSVLDAGLMLYMVSKFESAYERYGPRGYRYIHLLAGIIGQNIYLTGQALGLGVCAIGAFYDDEILELLGLDPDGQSAIYAMAAGKKGVS